MDIILPCEFLNGAWETGFHSRARGGCHVSTFFGSGRDTSTIAYPMYYYIYKKLGSGVRLCAEKVLAPRQHP